MNMTSSNPHRIEVIASVERTMRWAPAEKKAMGEVLWATILQTSDLLNHQS